MRLALSDCRAAVEGEKRKMPNRKLEQHNSPDRTTRAVAVSQARKGRRGWLFGAYTFLLLWGVAYLVLFFTNRLPI
jgi:hypothetical protein